MKVMDFVKFTKLLDWYQVESDRLRSEYKSILELPITEQLERMSDFDRRYARHAEIGREYLAPVAEVYGIRVEEVNILQIPPHLRLM